MLFFFLLSGVGSISGVGSFCGVGSCWDVGSFAVTALFQCTKHNVSCVVGCRIIAVWAQWIFHYFFLFARQAQRGTGCPDETKPMTSVETSTVGAVGVGSH